MPTPEASALAEEVFYMDTPEEVAEALDRFAAQRGAEPLLRKIERILVEDTNAEDDPCCGWGPLLAEVRATLAGGAPAQTGGGDAEERARACVKNFWGWFCGRDNYEQIGEFVEAALRDSYREGATAMREAEKTEKVAPR